MRVLHVTAGLHGGAGIAMRRINEALLACGVKSDMYYVRPYHKEVAKISLLDKKINGLINIILSKCIGNDSLNLFSSKIVRILNQSNADIIHLHWLNAEMLSIKQIAKIKKPMVWTFHDMWPLCGSEHYVSDSFFDQNYAVNASGKPKKFRNKFTFNMKKKAWRSLQLEIVCPGNWLADCVRKSQLFHTKQPTVIYNCLNLDVFFPRRNRDEIRNSLGLPLKKKIILFGAFNPEHERKGGDLLLAALDLLKNKNDMVVAIFGTKEKIYEQFGLSFYELGSFSADEELAELYSAADIMCVPSRQESFGQTASEPLACGIPVVAFNSTGLRDVVDHQENGYLASPFSVEDYTIGIEWCLDEANYSMLSKNGISKAGKAFHRDKIAAEYINIYNQLVT